MKSFPKRPLAASLSFILTLGAASSAIAATDTQQIKQLPAVEVSASRTAAQLNQQPVGQVTIGRQQLDRMPATNLADALRSLGGVHISSLYGTATTGNYSKIDTLGFGATAAQNTLIMLDGRRLNTVDSSSVNLASIPLSAIDHIEMLPGSGSVLYGNGASGGVINIVTRSHYGNAGHIGTVIGEDNTRGGGVSGSFNKGDVNGMVSLNRLLTDGYRENNANAQSHAFGDLRYSHGNNHYYLTVMADKQHIELPGALANNLLHQPKQTSYPNDWAEDKTFRVMPGMSMQFNRQVTFYFDSGFRKRQQTSFYDFGGGYTGGGETYDRTLTLNPRLVGHSDNLFTHKWTLGWDFLNTRYHGDQNAYGKERFKRKVNAFYAQDSIGLTASTWLTLGLRHEWLTTSKEDTPNFAQQDKEVGMWSAGLRQQLSDVVSLFANVERSARYATVDELRPPLAFPPNPICTSSNCPLATQTGKTYSLGASWKKGGQYSTLTLWQADYRHEIAFNPTTGANINLDDTKRSGVSLNSYWQLDKTLWLAVSGTYQNAYFDDGPNQDERVPVVPRLKGYVRADWQPLTSLSLSVAERYVGDQVFDNDQANSFYKRIPSYHMMDASVTYRPSGKKGVYITAAVYNVTNKKGAYDYASTTSYTPDPKDYTAYPLPNRTWLVKAGIDF